MAAERLSLSNAEDCLSSEGGHQGLLARRPSVEGDGEAERRAAGIGHRASGIHSEPKKGPPTASLFSTSEREAYAPTAEYPFSRSANCCSDRIPLCSASTIHCWSDFSALSAPRSSINATKRARNSHTVVKVGRFASAACMRSRASLSSQRPPSARARRTRRGTAFTLSPA